MLLILIYNTLLIRLIGIFIEHGNKNSKITSNEKEVIIYQYGYVGFGFKNSSLSKK